MSKAGGDEGRGAGGGGGEKAEQPEDETPEGKVPGKLSAAPAGPGWTKVSCPCCVAERVEPLVLVKLGEKVRPETKRWLIRLIGSAQKDGGEGLNVLSCSLMQGSVYCIECNRAEELRQSKRF